MITHFTDIRITDLARWIGAKVIGPVPETFRYMESDTRNMTRGSGGIYIAIKGKNHDGHDFVTNALKAGAVAAIVSSEWAESHAEDSLPLLVLDGNVWKKLSEAVQRWHDSTSARVISVTGSAGKTTVRELLTSALSAGNLNIHETDGNFNGGYDTLLTVLQTPPEARYSVIELGIRFPGAMDRRASVLRPDIGIITSIGTAHLGNFGSRERLAEEKIRMLEHLSGKPGSFAVVSRDENFIDMMRQRSKAPLVEVSLRDESAPYFGRVLDVSTATMDVVEKASGMVTKVSLGRPGLHLCSNALLAFACARELGVEPKRCAWGISEFTVPGERWKTIVRDGVSFIDDSYNSNPAAAQAVLDAFSLLPGHKIAVLGDMLELGPYGEELHREVGAHAAKAAIDAFVSVGPLSLHLADEIDAARPDQKVIRTLDAQEAKTALAEILQKGDTVLLKGSNGMHLSSILEG